GALFWSARTGSGRRCGWVVFFSLPILGGSAVAGLGSLWGILIGAAFVGLFPQVSTSVPVIGAQHGRAVIFGAAVTLVMLLLPDGFAGLLRKIRRPARA